MRFKDLAPQWPDAVYFRGEIFAPEDVGYERVGEIFNEVVRGRPGVIARCAGASDVRLALRLARERGWEVSVRGGGHHVAGWASNNGGLVIDLSLMRSVRVDPVSSTAWVGGGTRASEVVIEAAQFGLAPVTGTFPLVGIAGLALGIGEGHFSPRYGFAADNILALEVVTADGAVLTVSADENPDLFWAMRGAGANFGVVTALLLRLHPAPEQAVGGFVEFDGAYARQVMRHVWEVMRAGSPFFFPTVQYLVNDDGEFRVQVWPGHTGPAELADREVGALRECAQPVADEIQTMPYIGLAFDEVARSGDFSPSGRLVGPHRRHVWDIYRFEFAHLPQRQIDFVLKQAQTLTQSTRFVSWRTVPIESPDPPNVVPRLAGINVVLIAYGVDPSTDDKNLRWVQDTGAVFAGATGEAANAVNHVSVLNPDRVKKLYGDTYPRLTQLKKKYDPENIFHRNYNIPPE